MSDEDRSAEAEADAILAELMGTTLAAETPKAPAPAPAPKAAPAAVKAPAPAPKATAPAPAPKVAPPPAAAPKAPAPTAVATPKPEAAPPAAAKAISSDAVKPTPPDAMGNAKIDAPQDAIDAMMDAGNEDAKIHIDMQEDEILNALNSSTPPSDSDLEKETLLHIPPPALSLEERFQGKAREICYQVLNEVLEEQLKGDFVEIVKDKIKELLVLTLEEQPLALIKSETKNTTPKKAA